MKTLKEKQLITGKFTGEDVKEALNNFYKDYWESSHTGDKFKKYITCDELDYLINKHFGTLVDIQTLQELPNN